MCIDVHRLPNGVKHKHEHTHTHKHNNKDTNNTNITSNTNSTNNTNNTNNQDKRFLCRSANNSHDLPYLCLYNLSVSSSNTWCMPNIDPRFPASVAAPPKPACLLGEARWCMYAQHVGVYIYIYAYINTYVYIHI